MNPDLYDMAFSPPLCSATVSLVDFTDGCTRTLCNAILPIAVILLMCLLSIRLPLPHFVTSPFKTHLPLREAEALASEGDKELTGSDKPPAPPLWKTLIIAITGLTQIIYHLTIAFQFYFKYPSPTSYPLTLLFPFLLSVSWLYSFRIAFKPCATVPLDLFSVYVMLLVGDLIQLGGMIYDHQVYRAQIPFTTIAELVIQLTSVLLVLGVVLSMPFAVPGTTVKEEEIGKTLTVEDYTTLWRWITFSWLTPLIKKGRNTTLNESDVWNLSPTLQSKPVFTTFSSITRRTLLRRLWAANAQYVLFDFSIKYISVVFSYGAPFFLKRILDSIDLANPTPESTINAYFYAIMAFISALIKTQADAQHLYFGRRLATRVRTQLMASIYDKALKRKDYSGIVDKDKANMNEGSDKKPDAKAKKDVAKSGKGKNAANSDDPKAGAGIGKIVNLMSADTNRIGRIVSGAYQIYGAPLEIIIAGFYLYQLLGLSAFAGFIVLIVCWPLNSYIARRGIRITKGVLAAKDDRMGILNELIIAVKFIKFFAWEEKWIKRTMDAREVEIQWIIKARINQVMFSLLWSIVPILVSIVSFFTYVMLGNELNVSTAFTAIVLFGMIRAPLNVIPSWIVQFLQAGVALKRIAVFLDEEEVDGQVSSLKPNSAEHDGTFDRWGLGFKDATLRWNVVPEKNENKGKKAAPPTTGADNESVMTSATVVEDVDVLRQFELKYIDIIFPEGQLSVITGPTASGKTALLVALLGEMTLTRGEIIMSKDTSSIDEYGYMQSISYSAQSPWLQHRSIKDNILFGYPYDEERYTAVVEACALNPDLAVLEDGDATEIGARGVNLSGGQKARVALARAVYSRTKYVLLDDPLSAVDSHTSRFLYEKLLCGPLLANRTVILVTHHVELVLPGTYYLVRMLDGRIDTQGTTRELRARGLLDIITHEAELVAEKENKIDNEVAAVEGTESTAKKTKKPKRLVKDEHRETGRVKWKIYKTYLKASSYRIWLCLLVLIFFNQLVGISEKFWIKTWGDAYPKEESQIYIQNLFSVTSELEMSENTLLYRAIPNQHFLGGATTGSSSIKIKLPNATEHPLFYVSIYAAIGLGGALVNVLSVTTQYTGALHASRKLFGQLLTTVVHATFRFHDTTPQGRMINRFGKDIDTIDSTLAGSLQSVNSHMAGFFASLLTVAIVFPYFLIPAFFIGLTYRDLAIGYLNTGRDLRRMESNTRSPILSDFGELLEGIVTVRAFSAERRFLNNFHGKIDTTTKMWYMFWMTNRWLLINFDVLGAIAVLITTIFSIATLSNSAGLAGVCITCAMAFTNSVYWACRNWTTLELDLNAVERVVEYLDLPQEPPAIIESNRVPAYWPSSANNNALISVENLVIKYAPDLPSVLQGVSFTLKAGERVGLIGRTGSGKSTLAMSILRFVDPRSGRIIIDGIDISTIGVHDLRSRLTFIPQDATLFSGTLRDNLDPFGEHEDSECLDALYRVHLISPRVEASSSSTLQSELVPSGLDPDSADDTVSTSGTEVDTKPAITLDTEVSAGGSNFSQGQRQLIAMARALLRRSAIIVLDEATSSIDFATDAKIQTAIREEFKDSLLLTIAHRLHTIIDYDRLIVLDNGQIAEFDTPWNLIQKEDGIFRTMCLKSGQYNELEAMAKSTAQSR